MLSLVIPVFNEEENLKALHDETVAALAPEGFDYEMIFVDDGSKDRSFPILQELSRQNRSVKVIRLRKNFGQSAAMSAGIDAASGEYIITLDADRQNDPKDIPMIYKKIKEGNADIVSGWRKNRQDSFLSRVFVSRIANSLISWITKVDLHDYGCTLKIYKADVLKNVSLYGELHRFIPALASWQGAAVEEIAVNHRPRTAGKSKYGLKRIYKVLFDLLAVKYFLSYNAKPLHFFGSIGFFITLPGLLVALWISFQRIFFHANIAPRIPSLIFSALSLLMGVQIIMIGLLADLVVRNSQQNAKGMNRHYLIRETAGF